MKLRLCFIFLVVAVVALVGSPAEAKDKKTKFKPKPIEFHEPIVEAVGADSVTVRVDQVTKTYAVTQFTEIKVGGQPAKLADLRPGMIANVVIGLDPLKASRIEASGAPASKKR